jgi:hypothetical protein
LRILILTVAVGVLFPRDAFAYLDPGTGSMVFQTVVAALAAVAYGVRVYWARIRRWFSGGSNVPPPDDAGHPPGHPTEPR